MRPFRITSLHPILFGVLVLASAPAQAQISIKHDFRDAHFDTDALRYDSDESMNFVTPEKEGLRIRFAPPDVPKWPVGVRFKTPLIGDFETTARYEILKVVRPAQGYGVGVELYLMLENPARKQADGIALARLINPKGDLGFAYSHRANDEKEKRFTKLGKFEPTNSASERGRLRMARTGVVLTTSIAEGDSDTFKEVVRSEVGDADVRIVRIAGIPAGDANATLDLRILDFEIKGNLPGLEKVKLANKDVQAAPAPKGEAVAEPARSSRWFLLIAVLVVVGLGVILAVMLVIVWLRSAAAKASK